MAIFGSTMLIYIALSFPISSALEDMDIHVNIHL